MSATNPNIFGSTTVDEQNAAREATPQGVPEEIINNALKRATEPAGSPEGVPQEVSQERTPETPSTRNFFAETSVEPSSNILEAGVPRPTIGNESATYTNWTQPTPATIESSRENVQENTNETRREADASTVVDTATANTGRMLFTPTVAPSPVMNGVSTAVETVDSETGEVFVDSHKPRLFSDPPESDNRGWTANDSYSPESVGSPVGTRNTPYDSLGLDTKREKWAASEKLRGALGFRDFEVQGTETDASPSSLNKAFRKSAEYQRDQLKYAVQLKFESGNSFYDIMHPDDSLGMHEVSLGSDDLLAAITQPESTLFEEINQLRENMGLELLKLEECIDNIDILVNAINAPGFNYEVVMSKYPTNKGSSVNKRTLHISPGRGIGLHPTQAKMYNADFDGDEGLIVTDSSTVYQYNHALDYLIDPDGNPNIDPDYFPLDPVDPSERDNILASMRSFFNRSGRHKELANLADRIVDAYIDVCNNPDSAHWKEFILKLDEVADDYAINNGVKRYLINSYLLKNIYDFSVEGRGIRLRISFSEFQNYKLHSTPLDKATQFIYRINQVYEDKYKQGRAAMNFYDFVQTYNMVYVDTPIDIDPEDLKALERGEEPSELVKRKAVPFRDITNVSKAIGRSDLLTVGSALIGFDINGNEETIELNKLYEFTMFAMQSMRINGQLHLGGAEVAAIQLLKIRVQRYCPAPDFRSVDPNEYDIRFRQWIHTFVDAYNTWKRMLNFASVGWSAGMMPMFMNANGNVLEFDGIDSKTLEGLEHALREVYGDIEVDRFFAPLLESAQNSGRWDRTKFNDQTTAIGQEIVETEKGLEERLWTYSIINIRHLYHNWSLEQFALQNRIVVSREKTFHIDKNGFVERDKDGSIKLYEGDKPFYESVNQRIKEDKFTPSDILFKISQQRSRDYGKYSEAFLDSTSAQVHTKDETHKESRNIFVEIKEALQDKRFHYYASGLIEVAYSMSPEMYEYFGISSTIQFLMSDYGQELLNVKTTDEYRSKLVSMIIRYRLSRAASIQRSINEVNSGIESDENKSPEEIEERKLKLEARLMLELQDLSSSSMVWAAIVDEISTGSVAFGMLKSQQSDAKSTTNFRFAKSFWERENNTYTSLLDLLQSDEPYKTKINVLVDVVRLNQHFTGIGKNEIIGQLMSHPNPSASINRFSDGGRTITNDISDLKESVKMLDNVTQASPDNVSKIATEVIEAAREDPAAFESMIREFADNPAMMVRLDLELAADAVASSCAPTNDEASKTAHRATITSYWQAVSQQLNGGFASYFELSDNSVLNMISADRITFKDWVNIMGHPNVTWKMSDAYGAGTTFTRESICGSNSTKDLIDWLEKNPRIACCFRNYIVGARRTTARKSKPGAKVNAWSGATDVDAVYRVFSLFNNRYRFLAIAGAMESYNGQPTRNMYPKVEKALEDLCTFVAYNSYELKFLSGNERIRFLTDTLPKRIDSVLGISAAKANEAQMGKYKDFLDQFPDYSLDFGGEYANNMSILFATEIINEITECVEIASKSITGDQLKISREAYDEIENRSIDETSIIAYNFIKADLVGAQTNVMIGVEGSITTKNIELKDYLKRRHDKYRTITEYDPDTMAELDVINRDLHPEGLEKALADSPNHMIIAIVHAGIENDDETLNRTESRNFGSIAMKQEKEREDSAESGNAKTRKNGDDATNAIVKNLRFPSRRLLRHYGYSDHKVPNTDKDYWSIEDASDLVNSIESLTVENIEDAVKLLAENLIDADTRLGHVSDNFDPSDYYNQADLMIAANSDGSLVVRTLSQLAAAARSRLSDETIASIINDEAEFSYDNDPVVRELESILNDVGTDRDPMFRGTEQLMIDMSHETTLHSEIKGSHRFDRAMSDDSSSMMRNIDELSRMYRKYWGNRKEFPNLYKGRERVSSNKEMEEKTQANIRLLMNKEPGVSWGVNTEKASWFDIEKALGENPRTLASKVWMLTNSISGSFSYLGSTENDIIGQIEPGPLNMILFDNYNNPNFEKSIFNLCKNYGITALFVDYQKIPEEYREDVLEVDEGMYIIPFFDMAINGSASNPISPEPAEFYLLPDQLTTLLYDGTGTLGVGDSGAYYFPSLVGRLHTSWESRPYTYNITEVFPNISKTTGANSDVRLSTCETSEVISNILGDENTRFDADRSVLIVNGMEIPIDLGYPIGSDQYKKYAAIFMDRLNKYRERVYGDADATSIIWNDFKYDEIIGFVKFVNKGRTVSYAPLWVARFGERGRFPATARLTKFEMSDSKLTMQFGYFGTPDNAVMKGFAGDFGSMKFVGKLTEHEQMYMPNGRAIDIAVDKNSASNKFAGGNLRVDSLITSFLIAKTSPDYTFNYAEFEGFFPGVTDVTLENGDVINLREAVYNNMLGVADWRHLVRSKQIKKFSSFPDINDLLSRWWYLCDKYNINFNIFLSSRGADPRFPDLPRVTEFWPFFDKSFAWQNAYMHYMSLSGTNIMPESMDKPINDSENYLFIPVSPSMMEKYNWYYQNEDVGVLQQVIDYKGVDENGQSYTYKVPSTVIAYTGFFSDTLNTLVNKPNISASQNTIDTLNVAPRPNKKNRYLLLKYGRAGFVNINKINGKYIDLDLSTIFDGQEDETSKTPIDSEAAPQPPVTTVADPSKDGIDHVNIYKSKKSQIAAVMDPASPVIGSKIVEGQDGDIITPMRFKEGNFNTIWGYLFFLRYKSALDKNEKDALKTLSGEELYKFCAELQQNHELPKDTIGIEELKAKIDNAVDKKLGLIGNPDSEYPIDFFDKLLDLPMTMYVVKDGKVIMKTGNITNYLLESINKHIIKRRNKILRLSKKEAEQNVPDVEEKPNVVAEEPKTTHGLRGLLGMFGKRSKKDVQ